MNIVAIIQARLTGTRLAGKVLRKFGKQEVLWHVMERTLAAVPRIVLAIPDTPTNDPLAQWCYDYRPFKGMIYRGPEHDVLARYWGAAIMSGAEWIVRITADCPLVDPSEIQRVIAASIATGQYARNDPSLPRGRDVEAFSIRELADAMYHATSAYDREHVTPWMTQDIRDSQWHEALRQSLAARQCRTKEHILKKKPRQRWTLDTPEDAAWFDRLAQQVNTEPPHPTVQEVEDYIARTGDVLYDPEPVQ